MAQTTGPILAIGGITVANQVLLSGQPLNWKIPIATGLAAGMFALAEKAWPDGAKAIAWVALVTLLFVRIDPNTKSPVENLREITK